MAPHKNAGFSLLEVIISLLLLSIMLSGLMILELHATQLSITADHLAHAATQLENMTERLRSVSHGLSREEEIHQWNAENQTLLPAGGGSVTTGNVITVYWGNRKSQCQTPSSDGRGGCLQADLRHLMEE